MKKPTYYELLRHPLWQAKRLQIMQRDQFHCPHCGATDKTLNVHHTYYEKGKKPWEYPAESLVTLCEECHEAAEAEKVALNRAIGMAGYTQSLRIAGYAAVLALYEDHAPSVMPVRSYAEAAGIADGLGSGVTADEVIDMTVHGLISTEVLRDMDMAKIHAAVEAKHGYDPDRTEDQDWQ